ncbi:hypothetical protein PB01_16015 [Psychrobacillus glaciei]|uniref:Uncharacterized protein n=1 Tax=Psychrobacillus glaciei TaxID=2283160 RepID=A0A5J6STF5_9BACI|nr:hypothetical protein [Psychrobacillus glaciei]QFG00195.1 hypothetical protein PB01_16015 [Psychrobacillus glaciei]
MKNHVSTTFYMLPMLWFNAIATFIFEIYISFLFIKFWSVRWNWSLILCVTIPCFIVACYSPVIDTIVQSTTSDLNSFSVPIPFWMMKINSLRIPSIVAGITLMVGMLGRENEVS